jgi:hypothetical protein
MRRQAEMPLMPELNREYDFITFAVNGLRIITVPAGKI